MGFLVLFILDGRPDHQAYYRLTFSIKPFANVIRNHTCRDGKNKRSYNFQGVHLLPVASIGVGNVYIISEKMKLVYENITHTQWSVQYEIEICIKYNVPQLLSIKYVKTLDKWGIYSVIYI